MVGLKPSIFHGDFQQEKKEEITQQRQKCKREEEEEDKDVRGWANYGLHRREEGVYFLEATKMSYEMG